ncbi:MAG TPA: hypothetical protein VFT95_18835 [Micromonosporaceae bacterium]|nr:hypothetical protein [Micromonosporaceae bacterium]
MHEAEELERLRAQVLGSAHDLANAVGVALNYVTFLGEDLGGADPDHPVWQKLEPIEAALRRAADSVRVLRDRANEGAARGGAGGA